MDQEMDITCMQCGHIFRNARYFKSHMDFHEINRKKEKQKTKHFHDKCGVCELYSGWNDKTYLKNHLLACHKDPVKMGIKLNEFLHKNLNVVPCA
jgi:hypothetical protein